MNKKEFIHELKKNLKSIKKQDRDEILNDYEEHFRIGKKQKRKESEIAESLGDPKEIAKQAKEELKNSLSLRGMANDTFLVIWKRVKDYLRMAAQGTQEFCSKEIKELKKEKLEEKSKQSSEKEETKKNQKKNPFIPRLILTSFNLFIGIWIVLTVYISIGGLLISSWAITISGVIAFALSIVGLFVDLPYVSSELLPIGIFAGISVMSIGILMSIFSWQIGKLFSKVILRYMKFNKKIRRKSND